MRHKASDELARDTDKCHVHERRVPMHRCVDEGHDCDNDGENGPSQPSPRESEENPDVPEWLFLFFFVLPVDEGEWELGSLCGVRTYISA